VHIAQQAPRPSPDETPPLDPQLPDSPRKVGIER